MIDRCENANRREFVYYGGRGIKVCARWRKEFWNFLADMGERPDGMTIDRINTDGDYEPSNCRWATMAEQNANKGPRYQGKALEIDGVKFHSIKAACRAFGVNSLSVYYSINVTGMSPADAVKHHARRLLSP